MTQNAGWGSVGMDHDRAALAAQSIRARNTTGPYCLLPGIGVAVCPPEFRVELPGPAAPKGLVPAGVMPAWEPTWDAGLPTPPPPFGLASGLSLVGS